MKLIEKPSVYLVGKQVLAEEALGAFLEDHGVSWSSDSEVGAEVLCETAGRLCYMSYAAPRPGGNAAYLDNIKKCAHGSVLEGAVWNFIVANVSRSLSLELVRHRAGWGFSQRSQRYVDESEADYVIPPDLQLEVQCAYLFRNHNFAYPVEISPEDEEKWPQAVALFRQDPSGFYLAADAGELWLDTMQNCHQGYTALSAYLTAKASKARPDLGKTDARKFARQAARSVLPNATETKLFLTANARALRHFFEMRCSRHADPEIRILGYAMWEIMMVEAPNLFGDYSVTILEDGTHELSTPYRKV